jgi:hypothetical protein
MRDGVRLIAAAIVVSGILVAAAVAVTGRYSISKHHLGSDVQTIYGIDTWTGRAVREAARVRQMR